MIENEEDENAIAIVDNVRDSDPELAQDFLELMEPTTREVVRSMSMGSIDSPRAGRMKSCEVEHAATDILDFDDEPLYPEKTPDLDTIRNRNASKAKKTYNVDTDFERALDEDPKARLKMEAQRIQRNNPFTKMKRQNTRKALQAMQVIQSRTDELPKLEAWLDKQRKKNGTKTYQKRWVVV